MPESKTSTFTIHHDRCKPEEWTPYDVLQLANFVRHGDIRYAATLSRLGVQLVLSEHHVPKGGELHAIGWAEPDVPDGVADSLDELTESHEITPVVRVYSGPIEYAVEYAIGNEHGDVEGHETEVFDSEALAAAFLKRDESQ